MAVRAADERGNASVSTPLRVCFTTAGGGCTGFSFNDNACTDGCTGDNFIANELIGPFD